ncbi:MAG: carboxylating nicotinate-nucleotide diphosphorylase [Actinomycetota bacterium]
MQLPPDLDETLRRALTEDVGGGDVTSVAVIPDGAMGTARAIAKTGGVVAGGPVFERLFQLVDPGLLIRWIVLDGTSVSAGHVLGELRGSARSMLAGERVALNFLQHLSGIATLTRKFVDACEGTGSQILCTRKTLPGLRALERYAVQCGGGRLHRGGLDDGVLIKDNHVKVAGGVIEAVKRAKEGVPHTLKVEVEVDTLEQLQEALDAGADAILLDNAGLEVIKEAVAMVGGRVPLEISGGITLVNIREIALAGPVLISVGRITHSAPAMDISFEVMPSG